MKQYTFKKLKSEYTIKCMFGQCDNCSRIINDQGYHDLQVYQIYKTEHFEECENCSGQGTTEETCDECDGDGTITCPECNGEGSKDIECERCHGQKEYPIEADAEFVKNETVQK